MTTDLTLGALTALLLNGVVFALVGFAAVAIFRQKETSLHDWIVGPLAVALTGYAVFWVGFFAPTIGRVLSWVIVIAAAVVVSRRWRTVKVSVRRSAPVALATIFFVFGATALLLVYPGTSVSATAQNRFLPGMPGDNGIPRIFAEIIFSGNPTPVLGGDWLTSDRPPLQTGVALLSWPLLSALGFDSDMACATAGIWFQALWLPCVWSLLRMLGLSSRAAVGVVALLSATGVLVFNTIFVWPKLGGAAFVVAAFVLWLSRDSREPEVEQRRRLGLMLACALCGWLAHGGVMFSLAAWFPLMLAGMVGRPMRHWTLAAMVVVVLSAPWLLYQKFHAPPGNRLVKWHIAGAIAPDSRSVLQALGDNYREIGWRGAWEVRAHNVRMLVGGNFTDPFNPRSDGLTRRGDDVAFPLRTGAGWILGLAALPWLIFSRNREARRYLRVHLTILFLFLAGLGVWLGLMFFPDSLFTHQGTFVTQLLGLALLAAWARMAGRIFFAFVALVQWVGFLTAWTGPSTAPHGPANGFAIIVAVASGFALLALGMWTLVTNGAESENSS